jgi:hypothetical protein
MVFSLNLIGIFFEIEISLSEIFRFSPLLFCFFSASFLLLFFSSSSHPHFHYESLLLHNDGSCVFTQSERVDDDEVILKFEGFSHNKSNLHFK